MNILPFISFFLLTIAGFFIAMQNLTQNGCYRSIIILGEFQAERTARNQMQSCLFKSMNTVGLEPLKTPRKRTKVKEISHLRNFKRISEKHKLNIYHLIEVSSPETTELYCFCLQLLTALYKHCDFYTEKFPETVLHCLLEAGKKVMDPDNHFHILQIIPLIPTELDEHVLYQTLRGTNYYSVEKQEGIPPLLDFFTISPDKKQKPLYFPLLRPVYLNVAFGKKCAEALLIREQEKNQDKEKKNKTPILTKSELLKILEQWPQETGLQLDEIMAYSRPRIGKLDKQQVAGFDENTGIYIRKNF